MQAETPRGMRDYGPADAIRLQWILGRVEETFKRFGFSPIDTPAVEKAETLNAKAYGDESVKELFALDGGELGLRYDFTVPLARYVAMNKDMPLPFKRYQIGKVWRREEPQRMRSREFIQADVDIVGSSDSLSNAEVIAACAMALEEIGVSDYRILLNSRKIIDGILNLFEVPKEKYVVAIRSIDKLAKIGRSGVQQELAKLGIDSQKSDEILNLITEDGTNEEKLAKMKTKLGSGEESDALSALIKTLASYKMRAGMDVEFSLARGLDYYTGAIWEFVVYEEGKKLSSVGGGGRYDGLIGLYSKRELAAVGTSLGITRIAEFIKADSRKSLAQVFVAVIGDDARGYALGCANQMRMAGLYVDVDTSGRSISKQLDYASSLGIGYVAVVGKVEMESGMIKLRNMKTGDEEKLNVAAAISKLKVG